MKDRKRTLAAIGIILLLACKQEHRPSTVWKTTTEDSSAHPIAALVQPEEITPKTLPEIKKVYQITIEKLESKKLDSAVRNYDCSGERKGTVTYFSEKGKLRLIKHVYNEHDHFSAKDQYFVINDKLYFVYLNQVTWSFESAENTKDDITEQRIYLSDGKPIQCLEKKYTVRSKSTQNPDPLKVENKIVPFNATEKLLTHFNHLKKFANKKTGNCLEN